MSEKILMKGNEALSEAAIIAGCRHYFAYPITPQNEIPEYMSKRMPEVNGVFLQAESEIASINMVMGASAAGARVMTSSSSPGIALKQEGISYLSGAELPAVIVNMMRGGPGLGNIAGSQADYFQSTKGGGNGDYKLIVLAPSNVQELADLTVKAFDLADQYRMVVMILGDGYVAQMSEGITLPKTTNKKYDKNSWILSGAKERDSRFIASLRLIPDEALSNHNKNLQKKYKLIEENETMYETYNTQDHELLIAAFGLSARIAKKAVNELRQEGYKVGLFRPITLWPFPYKELINLNPKKVLTVEMNAGQMLEDIKLALNNKAELDFYGELGGLVPDHEIIIKKAKTLLAKKG